MKNKKISYFFNKYGGFLPQKIPPKNHPAQSDTLFFSDEITKTRKKFSQQ